MPNSILVKNNNITCYMHLAYGQLLLFSHLLHKNNCLSIITLLVICIRPTANVFGLSIWSLAIPLVFS
jgi:hypothetical protein